MFFSPVLLSALLFAQSFHFAILGDRTGEAQPNIYEKVWRQVQASRPAFAINVGDTIQGLQDGSAAAEWAALKPLLHHAFPFYLTPGNHDIWSAESEKIWRRVTGHPPDYSFDERGIHFTVLDTSRTGVLSDKQLKFLETDLAAHKTAALKFVVFHHPFWLIPVNFRNPDFPLHKLARQYGVTHIVSGHSHKYGQWTLDGIVYLMVGSSGGHLRGTAEQGWFFHWMDAEVDNRTVTLTVRKVN